MKTLIDLATLKGVDAWAAHLAEVKGRITELEAEADGGRFTEDQDAEFRALVARRAEAEAGLAELVARREYVAQMAEKDATTEAPVAPGSSPRSRSKLPDDLTDLAEYRARTSSQEAMVALMRDGAKKHADQARFPHPNATEERTVANIHKLLDEHDSGDETQGVAPGTIARRILATGSQIYGRAFGKYLAGIGLTPAEQAAINTVGTTAAGGYAVPYQLDPTIILTSDGATNPLRSMARIAQIAGNTWKGVTSGGITITRGPAESQPVTASEITLGQPEVTVQPVKAEVKFSIEAGEDWSTLQSEVARIFQDAKDVEEADSFVNGVGTTVFPEGIANLDLAISGVPTADTSGPITLALADLFSLRGALPPRFRPRAKYLATDAFYGRVRQLGSGAVGDASVWVYGIADGDPDRLLGKPAFETSALEDGMTEGEIIAIYGDFEHFLIAEKIGMTVELDPHVRDGNGKWTGERALLMHYRNSSKILADNAFRALVAGAVPS